MPNKDILLESDGAQGQAAASNGVNYLLVVAIDDYAHCPKLNNCVKDAKELIEVLEAKYGISVDHQTLPPLFNNEATRENITLSFRKLAKKVTREDSVLIYFSGHGEYDSDFNQGYWVPVEAEKGKVNTYLPNSEVFVFLKAVQSHHTFLMVDSCFSGALFMSKSVEKNLRRSEQDPSRWGLTSGRNEIVSDGELGKNSPFAESLLFRLRQNTGSLGVDELCAHVREYVEANSNQSPIGEPLRVEGHKNGLFVFKPKQENEDKVWAETLKSSTIASYTAFLERFPNGTHSKAARQIIRDLEEEKKWGEVSSSDSVVTLLDFLDKYPDGQFRREARERLDALEDEQDWQNACRRGKISDFLKYKDNHPDGKFVLEAEQRITALRKELLESDAWRKARNEHSVRGYQGYLEEYPNGANAARAREEQDALKKRAEGIRVELKPSSEEKPPVSPPLPSNEHQKMDQPIPTTPPTSQRWAMVIGVLVIIAALFAGIQLGVFGKKEEKAYKEAVSAQTIPAMESFLKRYPEGDYAAPAQKRLQDMENKLEDYIQDATLYIKMGLFEDAEELLGTAERIKPGDPRIKALLKEAAPAEEAATEEAAPGY